jgi:hypothetical protein
MSVNEASNASASDFMTIASPSSVAPFDFFALASFKPNRRLLILAIRLQCRNPSFHQIRTALGQPVASPYPPCWRTFIGCGIDDDAITRLALTAHLTLPHLHPFWPACIACIQTVVSTALPGIDVSDFTIISNLRKCSHSFHHHNTYTRNMYQI